MKSRELMALEESLGYHFQRQELIEQALTHSSQAREVEASGASNNLPGGGDNELLEFLGDAVLGLVASETLFHRFPGFPAGQGKWRRRAHLIICRAAAITNCLSFWETPCWDWPPARRYFTVSRDSMKG